MGRILIGNIKGPQGDAGKDFEFAKIYSSVSAMNADYSGTDVETGEYVIINSGNNDADNGKIYRKGSSAYNYVARIAGPTGPTGATGPMPTLYNDIDATVPGQAALDAAVGPTIAGKVDISGGETADTVTTFTSVDTTTDNAITAWTSMEKLTSGSPMKTLMNIISKAIKNIRWLNKKTDATNTAVSSLNDALASMAVKYRVVSATTTEAGIISLTALTPGNSTPLLVYDAAGHFYHIRRGSTTWIAIVKDASDVDPVKNTAVDAYVRYIDWS